MLVNRGYDCLCGHPSIIKTGKGPGCGGYFCSFHKGFVGVIKDGPHAGETVGLCDTCKANPKMLAMLIDED